MKVQLVAITFSFSLGSAASSSFHPRPEVVVPRSSVVKGEFDAKIVNKGNYEILASMPSVPRGGDLAGVAAKDIAQVFSGLTFIDALLGTLFPSSSMELFGIRVPPKSIRRFSMEAIGGVAGSLSISSYLAVTGKTSIEEAIAYGLISRLLFLIRAIFTNPGVALETPMCTLKAITYVALISAILSGAAAAPTLALKVVVGFTLLTSLSSYLNPSKAGKTIYNVDTDSEGELTKQLYRMAAGYDVLSCSYLMFLLYGIEPVKAVGYASLLGLAWLVEAMLITKVQDLVPGKMWDWMIPLPFAIFGSIAVGTLK